MADKKTIMVVDDNPDIITIVKTILEGKGYGVSSASSVWTRSDAMVSA
jgi:CheY-like chemotaxis protein